MAEIALSYLWTIKGYNESALVEGIGAISKQISFQKNTEDDVKILSRILSTFTSTSLIHIRDCAMNGWTALYTSRVHTAEAGRDFRQSGFRVGRAPFNSQLRCGLSFLSTREYRLPGAEISQQRLFTLQGIFRRVVVRRRDLMFVYNRDGNWHRCNLNELETLSLELVLRAQIALARRARG